MRNKLLKTPKLLCALIIVLSGLLQAQQGPVNVSTNKQAAIHGYDPVAYFTMAQAVEGTPEFAYEHQGSIWQFSNQQHLDLFMQNPEKYIPQYGGFCAYAASQGAKADIDPIAWRIIDDKLYLNYDLRVQKIWASNLNEHIQAADSFWSTQ